MSEVWLPYGSSDSSVIAQSDLKSEASILAIPGNGGGTPLRQGTGVQTFDSELGVDFGPDGGYYWWDIAAQSIDLDIAGQISIEVERDWISTEYAAGGSTGDVPLATEYLMTTIPASGNIGQIGIKTTAGTIQTSFFNAATNKAWDGNVVDTGTAANTNVNSSGKGRFVTYNVGWWGNTIVHAIDGIIVSGGVFNKSTNSNIFQRFYLGRDRTVAGTGPNGRYCRNFQISTKPPNFSVNPRFGSVMLYGDSFVNTSNLVVDNWNPPQVTHLETHLVHSIRREFVKRGIGMGKFRQFTAGGHCVELAAPNGNTSIQTYNNTVLAENPTCMITRLGTNDGSTNPANFDITGFEADLKTLVSALMAKETMDTLVLGNVPPYYLQPELDYQVDAMNAVYDSIPAWWDAANPTRSGKVKISDWCTAWGGSANNIKAGVTEGQVAGTTDIHPSALGAFYGAQADAKALFGG